MNHLHTPGMPRFDAGQLHAAKLPIEAERLAGEIVASHLYTLFAGPGEESSLNGWSDKLRPIFRRWMQATLHYLSQQGRVQIPQPGTPRYRFTSVQPVDVLWQQWEREKTTWHNHGNHHAYLALIEACLRMLPEILTGAVPATDVMFPESSLHLVEGIYRDNLIADHCNDVLAQSLKAALVEKTARGERGVRLLEIGAGTGGTTQLLLPMLREFGDAIAEYCYTDLSKAFLLHAQEHYRPLLPALTTAIFDVSKPPAQQNVGVNRYDAVIATNVLHATPNMRETMRNAKAVLKRHGRVFINEISEWSWYTHFTFGLLDGWWLYEDEGLRLPGSPGLSPQAWASLLRAERFFDVEFPAQDSHELGQQVVVATSDGVVRQRLAKNTLPPQARAIAAPAITPAAAAVNAMATDDRVLHEKGIVLFRELIASALRMDAHELETHKPLESYGLDSILVVQLTTRLRKLFPSVRSTLFFEVRNIDGLVQHVLEQDRASLISALAAQGDTDATATTPERAVSSASATAPVGSAPTEQRRFGSRSAAPVSPAPQAQAADSHTTFDVAVIGISGRYPKAHDLEQFWQNLQSGRNCISEIPPERWEWQGYYDAEKGKDGKSYTKWGGFIDDIDKFDPLFFKIAPKEAKRIDPQERLFLETAYHAIEDSGHTPDTLAPSGNVGVFVGVMNSRYTVQPLYYSIANRVSYLFNFSGPSLAVDTACSSSLTAVHLALESLHSGMCDTAIAGGVNLIVDPQHMLELTAVGMLSQGPQCRSFGKNADGFVDSEGVGAVILKPLARAQRDGDHIYAVIKGSAVNSGGRTHGYTVPNPIAQAQVVSKALARANIDAADVSYIEAHGTGTPLGDPVEIAGLTKAFHASRHAASNNRPQRQYCAIGSLKSNIGHCESAAGIAGLSKILLQLKHQQLVPTLHVEEVNEEIDFSTTPFSLQRELMPWRRMAVAEASGTREIPRIAGISSFGAGGANAHVVVQEYQAPTPDAAYRTWLASRGTCIVPLSARTSEQLQQKIQQLHEFLLRQAGQVNLVELAYTMQVGREAMDERLALVADSIEDVQRQLSALLNSKLVERDIHRGTVKQNKEFIAACKAEPEFPQRLATWLAQHDAVKLAQHWAKGVDVDWTKLYCGQRPNRISLPRYPFARERHWKIEAQRPGSDKLPSSATYPLVQSNTSKPNAIVLSTGDEAVISASVGRSSISLPEPTPAADSPAARVSVHEHGEGLFSIAIEHAVFDASVQDQLLQALQAVQHRSDANTVLITGGDIEFLHGDRQSVERAIGARLYQAVQSFPLPTIAVMRGNASGAGFLLGALCDFMVCSRESRYAFSDPQRDFYPTSVETQLIAARFGDARADDLLYLSGAQSGQSMLDKGWSFPIVDSAQVMSTALTLAKDIAAKTRDVLCMLKKHFASALQPHVAALGNGTGRKLQHDDGAIGKQGRGALSLETLSVRDGIAIERGSDAVLTLCLSSNANALSLTTLLRNMQAALDEIAQFGGYRALVVRSDCAEFLPALDADGESDLTSLKATLSKFPVPVIAAFERNATGLGWLLGLSCDGCVYADHGRYSTSGLWQQRALLPWAVPMFHRRLGERTAKNILFNTSAVTGAELASAAGIVVPSANGGVLARALAIAESCPLLSPALLQQSRVRNRACGDQGQHAALTFQPASSDTGAQRRKSLPFVSASKAVEAQAHDNGVIVVRMVDRQAKNMFSPDLIQGLEDVFAHIDACDDYRVVVLCGYDTFFACGGTKENLLAIQRGKAKFTDAKIFQLPMTCKLPVIAAMQGHAIGGGWTLGMFADVCLFSEESRYISPYMKYGFTPGAGSTLISPATLGIDLAKETLFTANEYSGSQLRTKGLQHRCLARAELIPQALSLADTLATRTRDDLIALKRYFSMPWLAVLDETYEHELAMHEKSFVGRQDAWQGIQEHFLADDEALEVGVEPIAASSPILVSVPSSDGFAAPVIAHELKVMLAAELHMNVHDVDDDAKFVDLGLDSITGVTWVRRINSQYQTRIEATKVYSHPTLREFSEFVLRLIPGRPATTPVADFAGRPAPDALAASRAFTAAAHRDASAALCQDLKRLLAQELHMKEADVDEDRQFVDMGLDSITGVTWVRQINAIYGTKIEATKVYSHPTLVEFSRFVGTLPSVQARLQRDESAAAAPTDAGQRQPVSSLRKSSRNRSEQGTDAVAVIGMAGGFPRAKTLEEFWRNIAGAKDCIDPVPPQRWNMDDYFSEDISVLGTTNCRWMGALDDCDAFDPLFFNIAPTEAESMDPQQRILLQSCWHAIENAAINPRTLSGSRCGVFIGCGPTDYHERSAQHHYSAQGFTGASMSILAARISYFLNLQGPCLSLNTACSSSLVAIAQACDNLVAHNCDAALAGGVAVMAGPLMHVNTAQSGMLSADGRCFAFDQRANGFVPGEAVGVVMLKRLEDAERDGDIIHAIIRGWGVNQDGKTNGITAPNPVSQTRLMRGIYDKFGIDPEDIQLVEAHGTGTKLGDPIEVEGLNDAFRHYTRKSHYCALGSVKSNIGHCLYAAGVASVLKLVLGFKHRQLPPAANFERLNEHIDLTDSPFVVNTDLKAWPANAKGTRLAAVSSFGFSGTNAHLVLEAGVPMSSGAKSDDTLSRPVMITLSAKTQEQLRQKALDLADFLAQDDVSPSLADIAYTLMVGREAMDERCATLVQSKSQLIKRLRALAAGETSRDMHVGSTSSRASKLGFIQDRELQNALIEKCIRDGKLDKLVELWVDGLDLAWDQVDAHMPSTGQGRRRVELPLYPFAKERYWLAADVSRAAPTGADATAVIHPLLHVNASTLTRQRYRVTLRGDEFFLRDHRIRLADGRVEKILPGVAYLEMAIAAVSDAMPERGASQQRLVLKNVTWWRPVIVDGSTAIAVELGIEDDGTIAYEIVSETDGERVLHCDGEAEFADGGDAPDVDAAFVASALNGDGWGSDDIYDAFTQIGLHYGPAHRGIERLCRADGTVFAKVSLPPSLAKDKGAYRLHPSVMDAALQACIGLFPSLQALPSAPSVPFALQSISIRAACPSEVFVALTPRASLTNGAAVDTCDIGVYALDGRLCVEMRGFTWRAVDGQSAASTESVLRADPADETPAFDEAFYRELLASIANRETSAEEAVELG